MCSLTSAFPKKWIIVPAGGIGERMGLAFPKQLYPCGDGQTVIERVVALFEPDPIAIPVPPAHLDRFAAALGERARLVPGGATRFQSVRNAFEALPGPADDDLILIHDAARPFLDPATLPEAWSRARDSGAIIYASPAVDTIKQVDAGGAIARTLDRRTIYHAQTPQIFRAGLLRRAYAAYDARSGAEPPTDEAALLEMAGIPVNIFPSSPRNCKLTHREDLGLLDVDAFRIGHGYDVHRFDAERPLYLGGILIPGAPGLAGHSDADAAIHALIDALLGAAGRGDIGRWFPDDDSRYKDIRSTELLAEVWNDLRGQGYRLVNADLTIQAQRPRLAPHIDAMRACLAGILDCAPGRVNVKATTTEKLGFVGRCEGVAAEAAALLRREAAL